MGEGPATKVVRDLIRQTEEAGGTLDKLDVNQDMYDDLVKESWPQNLFDTFGIPITLDNAIGQAEEGDTVQ